MAGASIQQLHYLKASQPYLQAKGFSCSIANCNKNKRKQRYIRCPCYNYISPLKPQEVEIAEQRLYRA